MAYCADNGISLNFFSEYGKFLARVEGAQQGNVMLRKAQYRISEQNEAMRIKIVHSILMNKLENSRDILMRAARSENQKELSALLDAISQIENCISSMKTTRDTDAMRGIEGAAAAAYFRAFPLLLRTNDPVFIFHGRAQHPATDAVNALLSYTYTLLKNDAVSALEAVGLDPQCGFMHSLRPGRPALALDLMEPFRAPICDRLVISLINRKQINAESFTTDGGLPFLTPDARKTVLTAWQERKQEEIIHPALGERIPVGLILYAQAMLLARCVRGDSDTYPPYRWR